MPGAASYSAALAMRCLGGQPCLEVMLGIVVLPCRALRRHGCTYPAIRRPHGGSTASSASTAEGSCAIPVMELQVQMQAMTRRMAVLEAKLNGSRERAMLGEAAYLLNKAAASIVFGSTEKRSLRGMTLSEIRSEAMDGELSEDKMARWNKFRAFLQQRGWSIGTASKLLQGKLQSQGLRDAHNCGEEDRSKVTLEQLQAWVERRFAPRRCNKHEILWRWRPASGSQGGRSCWHATMLIMCA